MRNIYLIGFMGTGKTTIGRLLASDLGKEFVEMDEIIEREQGISIQEIFRQHGEPYFRQLEKKLLKLISARQDLVISCGGGLVCDQDNIAVLKTTGVVICLVASSSTIYERTKDSAQRPLLNVKDPQAAIEALLLKRQAFYRQADFSIDTGSMTPAQVVEKARKVIDA